MIALAHHHTVFAAKCNDYVARLRITDIDTDVPDHKSRHVRQF